MFNDFMSYAFAAVAGVCFIKGLSILTQGGR